MGKPKIRFKGFTEEWEQRKLLDISDIVTGTTPPTKDKDNYDGNRLFVSPADIQGNRFIERTITTLTEKGHALGRELRPGTSLFVSIGSTIGKVAQIEEFVTTNQQINAVIPYDKMEDDFVFTMLENEADKIKKLSAQQAVPIINKSTFGNIEVKYPKKEEQMKIGKYFKELDHLITLHQRKCDETKKLKKYMLQKMFPQNGMKVPEIRFEGFTGDWEQRKVKEFIDEGIIEVPMDGNHGEKHPTASEYVNNGIPFLMASDIHNGEVDINYCKYITRERAEKLDKGFAKNGDVLITHKATIGETAILQGLEEEYAVLTPQVTYYRIRDEKQLNRKYLYAFFNSEDFQNDLKKKAAQSTRPYIGISAQQNLMISLPQNRKEQKQIGEYFFSLDHLITLHQRKCDELMKVKKYMLQNMFV